MSKLILRFGMLSVLLFVLMEIGKLSAFSSIRYKEFIIVIACLSLVAFGFLLKTHWTTKRKSLHHPDQNQAAKMKFLNISERELEVLYSISQGLSNQEIASKLFISENTVKTHISHIFDKLQARRRTEAINKAKEIGIL